MSYPNYRISVELIFVNKGKFLLTKRSENAIVAPGVWNVPAGKVKYDEVPIQAVHREAMEETGLKLDRVKEVAVRNQSWKNGQDDYYRVIYTYLVQAEELDYSHLKLNDEHTEYCWIGLEELSDDKFHSLHPELKRILVDKIIDYFDMEIGGKH